MNINSNYPVLPLFRHLRPYSPTRKLSDLVSRVYKLVHITNSAVCLCARGYVLSNTVSHFFIILPCCRRWGCWDILTRNMQGNLPALKFSGPRIGDSNMNMTCHRLLGRKCVHWPSQEQVHIREGVLLTHESGNQACAMYSTWDSVTWLSKNRKTVKMVPPHFKQPTGFFILGQ